MPRIQAIDWDRREVRCLWASSRAGRITVLATAAATLPAPAAGENAAPALVQALRHAMAGQRPAAVAVLGLDRAQVELIEFTVPPARDVELPELIFNQAMRESPAVTDDSAVDFRVRGQDPTQPRQVTVAAMSAEQAGRVRQACAAVGVRPRRMVVRPYAAASLFVRTASVPPDACLLVNVIGEEVDLTVLANREPAYLRTVRLPGDAGDEKVAARLLAEIKRTLAVAQDEQLAARGVEAIYIIAGPGEHAELVERVHAETAIATETFNPFQALGVPAPRVPEGAGRFAPLLGMALDEACGSAHSLDLLRPRRRGPTGGRRRPVIFALAAGVLLAGAGWYWYSSAAAAIENENKDLTRQVRELTTLLKRSSDQRKVLEAVHEWQAGDVTWLDELRDLSIRFPSGRDMVLMGMSMTSAGRAGGGDIEMRGVVRDQSVVLRVESDMRDKYHELRSRRIQERRERWHFETSMSVGRREKNQYTSHLPAAPDTPPAVTPGAKVSPAAPAAAETTPRAAASTPSAAEPTAVHPARGAARTRSSGGGP